MLEAFLNTLKTSTHFTLIKRIQEQVFEKFLESNSVDKVDDQGPYYFPCFDIVPFAESKVFEAASDPNTRDINRKILYFLYEKMAGKTQEPEPEMSWTK